MPSLADPLDSAPPADGEPDRSADLKAHVALVRQVAFRLRQRLPAGTDMDELLQAGLIGLNDALERYRAELGASFGTYAARRIEGAMLDALRAGDELSRDVRARQREIRATVQALEHRLLRAPRAQEVANELGWSLAKFHRHMVEAGAAPMRVGDAPLADEADAEPAWAEPVDEDADPQRDLQRRQRHLALNRAFDALEERERLLMDLIYEHGLDQRDVAVTLGVTPSRISQLHAAVVEKLRRRLRDW
ncbi:MAG TPA: FliA/WhiG family RNA polymerase sigma factor [Methylibium sp.]|nr:FliA/WhiG family RNA polymerase sigma factor [Methylibium sp.]